MTVVLITKQMVTDGKKTLKRARKEVSKMPPGRDPELVADIAIQASHTPYFNANNIKSLVLRNDGGGWCADIMLQTVPDGVPDAVGNPEYYRFLSKPAAYEYACRLIYGLVQHQANGAPTQPATAGPMAK